MATKEPIFAILTLISMVWMVGSEIHGGIQQRGWKHEIVDTVISIVMILVLWFGLQFVLNTQTPVSAIVTCSMLPSLERGDLVITQGEEVNAYELVMSKEEFEQIKSYETIIEYGNKTFEVKGSMYSYCAYSTHSSTPDTICNYFILEPQKFIEKRGSLTYHYSRCDLKMEDGTIEKEPCVVSVDYNGKNYPINLSNDVLVYVPDSGTYFSYVGDIIHRVYFKVQVENETYYITKGDNNPILDIQMYEYNYGIGNLPAKNIHGKQIIRIPYVGYLKLFISNSFKAPEQCSTLLFYPYLT